MKKRYAKGMNLKNVLIVGAGEMGKSVAEKLSQYKDLGFVVKGFLDDERDMDEIVDVDGGIPVLGPLSQLEIHGILSDTHFLKTQERALPVAFVRWIVRSMR